MRRRERFDPQRPRKLRWATAGHVNLRWQGIVGMNFIVKCCQRTQDRCQFTHVDEAELDAQAMIDEPPQSSRHDRLLDPEPAHMQYLDRQSRVGGQRSLWLGARLVVILIDVNYPLQAFFAGCHFRTFIAVAERRKCDPLPNAVFKVEVTRFRLGIR
jgi:hypothetical protein